MDEFQKQLQEIEARHTTQGQKSWSEEEKRRADEAEKARVSAEFKKIPDRYRDFESEKDISAIIDKDLFLFGKCGTGKTVLAFSVVKARIKKGESLCYLSYPSFIMKMQSSYRDDNRSPFDEALKVARFPGVLLIDDLGAEKLTDFVRQITYFLINEREQWHLPLIITSNFSLDELADQIDIRIASRISGMCQRYEIRGEDKRAKGK